MSDEMNNASALEGVGDARSAFKFVDALCAKSSKIDRERLMGRTCIKHRAAIDAALAQQPAADPGACPACNRAWSEHRIGYSASACKMKQPAAVDEAMERVRLGPARLWQADLVGGQISIDRMHEILTAALAVQQGGQP